MVYRFDIIAYRVGDLMEMLIIILMWSAIYNGNTKIGDYTLPEMLTSLIIGNLVAVLLRNFLYEVISKDIKDGLLSAHLLKPIPYFRYIIIREIGRIAMVTMISGATQLVVTIFFIDRIILNNDPVVISVIVLMVVLAFIIEMLVSYLTGLIAFWQDEVNGLHYIILSLRKFFAGGYFPLSLLPAWFVTTSFLLPFAYSFFVPAQLYLGKLSIHAGLKGIAIELVWIVLLYLFIKITWHFGIKKYEGVGI
jgi:ABC-2 type transport system permease protein